MSGRKAIPVGPTARIQGATWEQLFSQTAIPTDQVDAEWLTKPRQWTIGKILHFILSMGLSARSGHLCPTSSPQLG